MRLVFMGTPEFAVNSLQALADAGHIIQAVYTQPDRPKGRGYGIVPPPVKVLAGSLGIEVFQPDSVKDEQVQRRIEELAPDCIVVVAYGKLLPARVLNAAKYGCVNVHSSLLPKYRGAAPIQWSVINGDSVTGVSTMLLDEGMDTGDILMQKETDIEPNETSGQLHDRLAVMGAELIVETLAALESGSIEPVKQDERQACHAPMLSKSLSPIKWDAGAQSVHNLVRGLQPWPVASTSIGGKRLRIHATEVVTGVSGSPGEVVSADPLIVSCGDGTGVKLLEIQIDGGKRMVAADYMRGHPIAVGTVLE